MEELEAQYKSLINDQQSQDSNSSDNSDDALSPLVMDLAEALKPDTRSRADSETDTCSSASSETESVASNEIRIPQKNNMKQLKNFVNFYKMTKSFEQKLKSLKKKNKNKAHFSMSSLSDAREAISECKPDIMRNLRKWSSVENVNLEDLELEFDLNSIRTRLLGMESLQCLEEPIILSPIMQVYAKEDGYCCDLNEPSEMEKDPLSNEEQDIKPFFANLLEETQLKEASPKKGGIKLRNITELVDVKSRLGDTGKRLNIPVKVDLRNLKVISKTKIVSSKTSTPTEMPKLGQTKVSSISKPYLCYSDNKSGLDNPVEEDDGFNPIIEATFSLAENKKQDQLCKVGLNIPSTELTAPNKLVSLASQENYTYIVNGDNTVAGTITNVQHDNTSKEPITNNLSKPIVSVNQTSPNRVKLNSEPYSTNTIPQKQVVLISHKYSQNTIPQKKTPLRVMISQKNSPNTIPQRKILHPQRPASITESTTEKHLPKPADPVDETTPTDKLINNYLEKIQPLQPNFTGEKINTKTSQPKLAPDTINRFFVDGKPFVFNMLNKALSATASEKNNVLGGQKKFIQVKQNGKMKMFTTSPTVRLPEDNLTMIEKQDLTSPTNQKVNIVNKVKLLSSVETSRFIPVEGKTLQQQVNIPRVPSVETSRFTTVGGKTILQVNSPPKLVSSVETSRITTVSGNSSQQQLKISSKLVPVKETPGFIPPGGKTLQLRNISPKIVPSIEVSTFTSVGGNSFASKLVPVVETSKLNKDSLYKPASLQPKVKQHTSPNSIQSYLVNNKPQAVINTNQISVATPNKTLNKRETIIGNMKLVKPGNNGMSTTVDLMNTENPNVSNLLKKPNVYVDSTTPSQNTGQVQQITKPSTVTKVSQKIKTTEEESTPQDFQSGETSSGLKLISTQSNTVPSPSTLAKTKLLFRNDLAKKDNFTKMLFKGTMPRNKLISPNMQNRYFCKWCRTGFCKHYLLWQHIYRITCNMVYECRHCADRRILFTNRCQLLQHLLVHFGSHKQIVINYNKLKMFKISTQDIMYSAHNGGASVRFYSDDEDTHEDSEEDESTPGTGTKQTSLSKSNFIRRPDGTITNRIKTNSHPTILDIFTGLKRRPGRPRAIPISPQTVTPTTLGKPTTVTSEPVQTISKQSIPATLLRKSTAVTPAPVSNQIIPATTLPGKSAAVTSAPVQIIPATILGNSAAVTSEPAQTISKQTLPATILGKSIAVTSKPVQKILTKKEGFENSKSSASKKSQVFINIKPDQNLTEANMFTITISSPTTNQNQCMSEQSSSLVTKSTVQSSSSTIAKSLLKIKTASNQPESSNTALETEIRKMLEREGYTNIILQTNNETTHIQGRTTYRATKKPVVTKQDEQETGLKLSHLRFESEGPGKNDSIDSNTVFVDKGAGESNQQKAVSDQTAGENNQQKAVSDKDDGETNQEKAVSDKASNEEKALSDIDDGESNQQKDVSDIDDAEINQQIAVSDKDGENKGVKRKSICLNTEIVQKKLKFEENKIESEPSEIKNKISGSENTVITQTGDKRTLEECGLDGGESPTKKLKLNTCDNTSSRNESENEKCSQNVNHDNESNNANSKSLCIVYDDTLTNVSEIITNLKTSMNDISKIKEQLLDKGVATISMENIACDGVSNECVDSVSNENNTCNINDKKVKDSRSEKQMKKIKEIFLRKGRENVSMADFMFKDSDSDENENNEKVKDSLSKNKDIVIEDITVNEEENDSFENSDNDTSNISDKKVKGFSEKQITKLKEILHKGRDDISMADFIDDDSDSNESENSTCNINDANVKDSKNKDILIEDITVNETNTNDSFENSDNDTDSIDNTDNITSENSDELSNPSHKEIVIENITFAESNENDDNISCDENITENDKVTENVIENDKVTENLTENDKVIENNENILDKSSKENNTEVESKENDIRNISCDENISDENITENDKVIENITENDKVIENITENDKVIENITENDKVMDNITENDKVIENNILDDETSKENKTELESNKNDEINNSSCDENGSDKNITENDKVIENILADETSKGNNTELESKEKESPETTVSDESMKLPISSVISS